MEARRSGRGFRRTSFRRCQRRGPHEMGDISLIYPHGKRANPLAMPTRCVLQVSNRLQPRRRRSDRPTVKQFALPFSSRIPLVHLAACFEQGGVSRLRAPASSHHRLSMLLSRTIYVTVRTRPRYSTPCCRRRPSSRLLSAACLLPSISCLGGSSNDGQRGCNFLPTTTWAGFRGNPNYLISCLSATIPFLS